MSGKLPSSKIIDSKTTDENGGEIQVARAKTSVQRERNAALKQACAKLKADSRNTGKEISIEWLIDGTKNRTVNINKRVVFFTDPPRYDRDFPISLSEFICLENLGGTLYESEC